MAGDGAAVDDMSPARGRDECGEIAIEVGLERDVEVGVDDQVFGCGGLRCERGVGAERDQVGDQREGLVGGEGGDIDDRAFERAGRDERWGDEVEILREGDGDGEDPDAARGGLGVGAPDGFECDGLRDGVLGALGGVERVDDVGDAHGGSAVAEAEAGRTLDQFGARAEDIDIVDADGGGADIAGGFDDRPDGAGLGVGLVLDDEDGGGEAVEVEALEEADFAALDIDDGEVVGLVGARGGGEDIGHGGVGDLDWLDLGGFGGKVLFVLGIRFEVGHHP